MKVYAGEAFYIPIKKIKPDQLETAHELNTFSFYKDKACEKCPYFEDRPCEVCESCPNNLGPVKLSKVVEKRDQLYLTLPIGDVKALGKIFPDEVINIQPRFPNAPMKKKFAFTGKLKDFQEAAVKDIIKYKRGVLKSKARTGKTVMGASAVARIGQKTLILAAQREWLLNFQETFIGSKTQEALTDISPKRIGLARTIEDFEKFDVCLTTYQLFLSPKGQKLLKRISSMFGVLIVDEVHKAAATAHAKVVSRLNCRYKIGLSATPDRKDNKYTVVRKLMGPIIHRTETTSLVPRILFTPTELQTSHNYSNWAYMIRFIESDPKRCALIARMAVRDASKGHLVLIPLTRIATVRALTTAINRMAGDEIAGSFYGGLPKFERDRVIQRARKYQLKVVVGNMKMISTGINIPRASAIYQCSPSANMPNAEQRFSRILTPFDGKPQPMIRVFADDMKVVKSCFRSEYWGVVNKLMRPEMTEEVKDQLFAWMNSSQRKPSFSNLKMGGSL
jgi:superfamily II DNA or RNA helicase